MASLQDCMTIARSGILTHQERLAVTSHNIVNVNTPGYHRQRVILGTNPAVNPTMLEKRLWPMGTGVTTLGVVQAYNQMQENVLLDQTVGASYHQTLAAALGDLEPLLAGTSAASLSNGFQAFWGAWHDVANNADSLAFRNVLIETSAQLTSQIRNLSGRLDAYRSRIVSGTSPDFSGVVVSEVDEVNRLASEIQALNSKISYSLSGFDPMDLKDKRTDFIRQLSEKLDIAVGADFSITLDGQTLVSADGATRNELTIADSGSPVALELRDSGGALVSAVDVDGGSLGAWLDAADIIDSPGGSLQLQLDTLATALLSSVNALHMAGYDLNGNAGIEFFTGADNDGDGLIDADTLAVNPLIYNSTNPLANDPSLVAAAATVYSAGPPAVPNPEDGAQALAIADLAGVSFAGLGGLRLDNYFESALAALGSRVTSEQELADDGQAILSMLTDAIQRETGVNLDEELMEMMSAQRAYEASSRLFSTIDQMIDLIINRLGA